MGFLEKRVNRFLDANPEKIVLFPLQREVRPSKPVRAHKCGEKTRRVARHRYR